MLITIPYRPRPQQLLLHRNHKRFNVDVIHRRFGKTVCKVNELIKGVLSNNLPEPHGAYICPTYKQAKRVAWGYLKQFSQGIPGVKFNKSDLEAHYPNGATIFMLGSENADSLRGMYLDHVVMDECAQINPVAWSEVIRPALSDRLGGCDFIGTPKGSGNLFYDLYHDVPNLGDDWTRSLLKYSDTNIILPAEIKALKREMGADEFEQEYNCSWNAALKGSYYASEMIKADEDKRIVDVPWDSNYEVITAWDIGWSDNNVIWFFQLIAGQIRVIDLLVCNNTPLPDIIAKLREKPYLYGTHIAPHDARVHEYGTGQTRVESAAKLGVQFRICPMVPVMDGIKAVQSALKRCVFDRVKTKVGVEALRQYRSEYDELKRVYSRKPLHSWESDYADAFRMFVVFMDGGQRSLNFAGGALDYANRDRAMRSP